jgi:HEAT repeat protein
MVESIDKTDKNSGGEKPVKKGLLVVLLLIFIAGIAAAMYFTSISFLVSKFTSDDPKMRRWAVNQVVKKGESAGPHMIKMVEDKTLEVELRRLAIFVLGEVKYKEGITKLLKIFSEGDHLILREQAAFALGRMGDHRVLSELVTGFDSAPKGLKLKIISALGELGSPGGLEVIERALDSKDDLIRQTAEYALIKLKEK